MDIDGALIIGERPLYPFQRLLPRVPGAGRGVSPASCPGNRYLFNSCRTAFTSSTLIRLPVLLIAIMLGPVSIAPFFPKVCTTLQMHPHGKVVHKKGDAAPGNPCCKKIKK